MVEQFKLSERRACRLVGLSRSSYRDPPVQAQKNLVLKDAIIEVAYSRRRFGYRRIHDMIRPRFPDVNHKRVYRLYKEAELSVRKRKKRKRPVDARLPLLQAQVPNEVWSMD